MNSYKLFYWNMTKIAPDSRDFFALDSGITNMNYFLYTLAVEFFNIIHALALVFYHSSKEATPFYWFFSMGDLVSTFMSLPSLVFWWTTCPQIPIALDISLSVTLLALMFGSLCHVWPSYKLRIQYLFMHGTNHRSGHGKGWIWFPLHPSNGTIREFISI